MATVTYMNDFQKGIISLLKAALTETEPDVSLQMDFGQLFSFAEYQQIVGVMYYGASQLPGFETHPIYPRFFERFCGYLGHSADQLETIQRIFSAFEREGIAYLPVKGTVIKELYPSPEMRTMADADILIRMEEYDRVRKVMQSMNCVEEYESDHEFSWMTPTGLQIELHKRLIPTYNKDYYAYYGDGWRLARPCEGSNCRYELSREDMFIYLFAHFAKHYRDQGVGIKYVADFYMYRKHYGDMDHRYIRRELGKLRLLEFYENILRLLDVWFEDASSDELTDYLTQKVFGDGVFGRSELGALSEGLKAAQTSKFYKAKKKRQLFFPPYATMCLHYPILRKLAFLLPILWMVRLVNLAIHHRDRYRIRMDEVDNLTDESIDQYRRELNYVGLDYHFGGDDPPTKRER